MTQEWKPLERFNLAQNYEEFARVRGFDLHTMEGNTGTAQKPSIQSHRDPRDPEQIGKAILAYRRRAKRMPVTQIADKVFEKMEVSDEE